MWFQASRLQRKGYNWPDKHHSGSVETKSVVSNVTAAASPFERGATTVAGYVSRWRSQHKYQKSFLLMDFQYLFYDTYPPASPDPSREGTRSSSQLDIVTGSKSVILLVWLQYHYLTDCFCFRCSLDYLSLQTNPIYIYS